MARRTRKNPGKKIGILGLAALGLGGYLVYKKFIKKDRTVSDVTSSAAAAPTKSSVQTKTTAKSALSKVSKMFS